MIEGICEAHSEVWIEDKNLVEEVNRIFGGPRILARDVYSTYPREGVEIFKCLLISHKAFVVITWSADHLENDGKLVS